MVLIISIFTAFLIMITIKHMMLMCTCKTSANRTVSPLAYLRTATGSFKFKFQCRLPSHVQHVNDTQVAFTNCPNAAINPASRIVQSCCCVSHRLNLTHETTVSTQWTCMLLSQHIHRIRFLRQPFNLCWITSLSASLSYDC